MNSDEVGLLLGLMALADNRKPPEDDEGREAMIGFWLSMVGDLRYIDAAEAVQQHYRESRNWIMPSDIRERVRAVRQGRLNITPVPPAPPDVADDPDAYREWRGTWRKRIADGDHVRPAIGGVAALEGDSQ
ncbi:MAG TPA: hypothetical protein VK599_22615 [Streptosporangiaceae bacterium]|nr:hypothetical protein [Streptosporangiaceae bacterium]